MTTSVEKTEFRVTVFTILFLLTNFNDFYCLCISFDFNKKSRRTVDTNSPQTNKNMESCTVKKSTRSLSSTQHTNSNGLI